MLLFWEWIKPVKLLFKFKDNNISFYLNLWRSALYQFVGNYGLVFRWTTFTGDNITFAFGSRVLPCCGWQHYGSVFWWKHYVWIFFGVTVFCWVILNLGTLALNILWCYCILLGNFEFVDIMSKYSDITVFFFFNFNDWLTDTKFFMHDFQLIPGSYLKNIADSEGCPP